MGRHARHHRRHFPSYLLTPDPPEDILSHPIFARLYANRQLKGLALHDDQGSRRELLEGLSGRVLEVGCGDGRNFEFYPPEVTRVVGIEPEPYLLDRAYTASINGHTPVELHWGHAEDVLTIAARKDLDQFDAVVFSLMLCSVADPVEVMREAKKVLLNGASVRFYEHVRAPGSRLARWQRMLRPFWSTVAGGCRPDLDLVPLVRREFAITRSRMFPFRATWSAWLVEPHVIMHGTYRDEEVEDRPSREGYQEHGSSR
jgi:SAM-dependent methyltransferase